MNVISPSRPFTEEDWNAYAGADEWPNGDDPVARVVGSRYVVADWRGAEFASEDDIEFRLRCSFTSQRAAMAFLDALPANFDPLAFGFVPEKTG